MSTRAASSSLERPCDAADPNYSFPAEQLMTLSLQSLSHPRKALEYDLQGVHFALCRQRLQQPIRADEREAKAGTESSCSSLRIL